jgi:eukaryotic-like serine/threonine-protein kinase
MIRGCLMFVFTLFFVSLFAFVAGYFTYTQIVRSQTVAMPSLLMKTEADALLAINEAGLKLSKIKAKLDHTHSAGTVLEQNPLPLTTVKLGRGVTIYVAKKGEVTTVPELRGDDEGNVRIEIGNQKLSVVRVARAYHPDLEVNKIIATYPPASAEVAADSGLELLVSRGQRPVIYVMPDLSLQKVDEARAMLGNPPSVSVERQAVGSGSLIGVVIDQTPKPGEKWSGLQPVTLVVGFMKG